MSKFHFCDNFSDNILKSKMLPKLKNARLFPSHRDIFFLKKITRIKCSESINERHQRITDRLLYGPFSQHALWNYFSIPDFTDLFVCCCFFFIAHCHLIFEMNMSLFKFNFILLLPINCLSA